MTYVNNISDMPVAWVEDEDKWEKAKELAKKQGKGDNYAYIVGIYKKMGGRIKKKSERSLKKAIKIFESLWIK